MENIIISVLDEQFKSECRIINLKYEYPGYVGYEQWAIITDLSEEELNSKYAGQIAPFRPYIVLDRSFDEVRDDFRRNEHKHKMRAVRSIEPFDYDDEVLAVHHPETLQDNLESDFIFKQECALLQEAISKLNATQKKRLTQFFFEGKSFSEISREEGVSYQAVQCSIENSIKKLRKIIGNRLVD